MKLTGFKSLKELIQYFKDEDVAREYLEAQRWEGCPTCPHCGSNKWWKIRNTHRYKCGDCKKKYSVTVGTVMENSNIPISAWLMAIYVISAHRKGISSIQLGKDIGVTQKSAWFLGHRIRQMFEEHHPLFTGMVEIDETYVGGKDRARRAKGKILKAGTGAVNKITVFGILQRGGKLIYRVVDGDSNGKTLKPIIRELVDRGAIINTDGHGAYKDLDKEFAQHEVVSHGTGEYVRGIYHTNTIESSFGNLKRGIIGIYHKMTRKHLQRYCHEFTYRFSTRTMKDYDRFEGLLQRLPGRLRYKDLIAKK